MISTSVKQNVMRFKLMQQTPFDIAVPAPLTTEPISENRARTVHVGIPPTPKGTCAVMDVVYLCCHNSQWSKRCQSTIAIWH